MSFIYGYIDLILIVVIQSCQNLDHLLFPFKTQQKLLTRESQYTKFPAQQLLFLLKNLSQIFTHIATAIFVCNWRANLQPPHKSSE